MRLASLLAAILLHCMFAILVANVERWDFAPRAQEIITVDLVELEPLPPHPSPPEQPPPKEPPAEEKRARPEPPPSKPITGPEKRKAHAAPPQRPPEPSPGDISARKRRSPRKTTVFDPTKTKAQADLDDLAVETRHASQASTAKHALNWRSLIAPEYGRHDFAGLYRAGPDRVLSVVYSQDSDALLFHDSKTGLLRRLTRKEGLHFVYGPGSNESESVEGVVIFMPVKPEDDQNKGIPWTSRLMWMPENPPAVMGDRVDFEEREVVYFHGDVPLSATLVRPKDEAEHPVVVRVPGETCRERERDMILARLLALRGLSTLLMHPRGCDNSGGNARAATVEQLAGDAAAALDFIRRTSGDKNAGLWSEPEQCPQSRLAAAESSPPPAFLVCSGGNALEQVAGLPCPGLLLTCPNHGIPPGPGYDVRSLSGESPLGRLAQAASEAAPWIRSHTEKP